jgi:hypothetical protein
MFGFFRDDLPLYQRILDAEGRRELDDCGASWTSSPGLPSGSTPTSCSTSGGVAHAARAAFDFIRAEDQSAAAPAMIRRLATAYVAARARASARRRDPAPSRAGALLPRRLGEHPARRARAAAAEPSHLAALVAFAGAPTAAR